MEDPIEALLDALSTYIGVADVTLQLVIGALGVLFLGIGFHKSSDSLSRSASIAGWPLIGLIFYLY